MCSQSLSTFSRHLLLPFQAPVVFLSAGAFSETWSADELIADNVVQEIETYLEGSSENPKGIHVSLLKSTHKKFKTEAVVWSF